MQNSKRAFVYEKDIANNSKKKEEERMDRYDRNYMDT